MPAIWLIANPLAFCLWIWGY